MSRPDQIPGSSPCRALALACLLAAGCASTTETSNEIEAARSSLEAARQAGATPSETSAAESKLSLTTRWMEASDYLPARWLAEQAKVDAELATVRAATRHSPTLPSGLGKRP